LARQYEGLEGLRTLRRRDMTPFFETVALFYEGVVAER
jgi:hypothetical protein